MAVASVVALDLLGGGSALLATNSRMKGMLTLPFQGALMYSTAASSDRFSTAMKRQTNA
jgi:hypothetical protein